MKSGPRMILMFLGGLLIFIGLPMLGWGIFHIPRFFDNPVRAAYVPVIIVLQLFAVLYLPRPVRGNEVRKSGVGQHTTDLRLIQLLSLAIMLVAPFSDRSATGAVNPGDTIRYFGLPLMVCGFLLMQFAEKHLGRQFSVEVTLKEDHELIMSGPYKFLRHPRYLGVLAFFLGISFIFRSYIAVSLVLLLFIVLIWRIFAEESLMRREFGTAWDEYCTRTWRMIPFIF